jgi:hypothetical protein
MSQTLTILDLFVDDIQFAISHRSTTKVFHSANILGAIALAHAARPEETKSFYARFTSGAGLESGGTVLMLRNFFISAEHKLQAQKASHMRAVIAELVLHALRLDIEKRLVTRLEFSTEGVEWFRELNADRVDKVKQLFVLPERLGCIKPKEQPTAAVAAAPDAARPTLDVVIQKVAMLYGTADFILLGKGEDRDIQYPRDAAITAMLALGYSEVLVAQKFKRSVDYLRGRVEHFGKHCNTATDCSHKRKNEKFAKLCRGLGLAPEVKP